MLDFQWVVSLFAPIDRRKAEAALGSLNWKKLSRKSWKDGGAYLAPDLHKALGSQSMPQRHQVAATVWKVIVDVTVLERQPLNPEKYRAPQHWTLVDPPAQRQDVRSGSTHLDTRTQYPLTRLGKQHPILGLEV